MVEQYFPPSQTSDLQFRGWTPTPSAARRRGIESPPSPHATGLPDSRQRQHCDKVARGHAHAAARARNSPTPVIGPSSPLPAPPGFL
ncbi:hypothetical protein KSP40_PGU008476 [Platanthera guangdongensis]|uniref:Uncharacterized protein n=1 Tax=Platanthera guangdongensis TaxID=2320717 RepID=A0ABR2MYN9_9ASPA